MVPETLSSLAWSAPIALDDSLETLYKCYIRDGCAARQPYSGAFQAGDVGSTPIRRSIQDKEIRDDGPGNPAHGPGNAPE